MIEDLEEILKNCEERKLKYEKRWGETSPLPVKALRDYIDKQKQKEAEIVSSGK